MQRLHQVRRLLGDTSLPLEGVDKTGSRAVVLGRRLRVVKLGLNLLGQDLSELDTPLVKGVDVPDGALGEGQVLVVGDQGTESTGGDLLSKDGGGGAVTEECLVGNELVGGTLGADLLRGLADHEGLGLGEVVGGEHPEKNVSQLKSVWGITKSQDLLLVHVVLNGVVGLGGQDEVGGDELGTLVEKLEEGVLGVCCGLTEHDGAGGVLDVVTAAGDGLTVGLHGELLKVGRETVEVLVERSDKVSLSTEEVRVPDAQKTTENGNVLLERSLAEVLVHGVTTSKELVEVVVANVEGDGKTNGGPDRVTATDPVSETEHVLLVNTELGDLDLVGGEGDEVLGNGRLILCRLEEPLLGSVGVGGSLGSGEGLGCDEEEGCLGVRVLEGLRHVGAVNVGDKVELEVVSVRLECLGDHDGTAVRRIGTRENDINKSDKQNSQIGTTNTDVDNSVNLLARVTGPLATPDLLGELLHVLEDGVDLLNDALSVNLHLLVGSVAECGVVHGSVLGEVDLLTLEHVISELLNLGLACELGEELKCFIGDEVL